MILLDNITFKNVIIIICLIKDHDNFISTYFMKKHCMPNKHHNNMWWESYVKKNNGFRKKIEWLILKD